ncbi:MAG: hypothetical protein RL621_60 [Bacteroidota bacterium]|jgi:hypothetical protein
MQNKSYLKIDSFGIKTYYKDKEKTIIHRENGPAIIDPRDYKEWWLNGQKYKSWCGCGHRSIAIFWWKNDLLHREDGPAVEMESGYREWCFEGRTHRENGPAIYNEKFGYKEYWTHGNRTMVVSPYGPLVTAHTDKFPEDLIKSYRSYFED